MRPVALSHQRLPRRVALSLAQRHQEPPRANRLLFPKNRVLRSPLSGERHLGMAQSFRRLRNLYPGDLPQPKHSEPVADDGPHHIWRRQWVLDHIIEPPEHRPVKESRMIGCCDEEALRIVLL